MFIGGLLAGLTRTVGTVDYGALVAGGDQNTAHLYLGFE